MEHNSSNPGVVSGLWIPMPFQIDEKTLGPDPFSEGSNRWNYFIPAEWSEIDTFNVTDHDKIFNSHDELVFMVRDLGDRVVSGAWIDDAESRNRGRIEIEVKDPLESGLAAYAYIYLSSTLSEPVPRPYDFDYDAARDSISTAAYAVDISDNGVIEDIILKTPGTAPVDIFDTQKIRVSGIYSTIFQIPLTINEQILYFVEGGIYSNGETAVVRLLREAKMGIGLPIEDFNPIFPITAKFYPYGGTISGGARLTEEDLARYLPLGSNIIMRDLRQSWDFNAAAAGMKFYNKRNDGLLIDGQPDVIDSLIKVMPEQPFPISEWTLTSGAQGSMFSLIRFKESNWGEVSLYYYDQSAGGQPDSGSFGDEDTGDGQSYGDQGISFRAFGASGITLELDFSAYFLPVPDLGTGDGTALAQTVENPVSFRAALSTDVAPIDGAGAPYSFELAQNYPNPFNGETRIVYSLPRAGEVILEIYSAGGRRVRTLVSGSQTAGPHHAEWDGRDNGGAETASGIYFCRLRAGGSMETRKLLLIK